MIGSIKVVMLHVVNGDATRVKLEPSGVPGDIAVWADVLHEGPVPKVPAEQLNAIRSAHFASIMGGPAADYAKIGKAWSDALDTYCNHDEVVFWFEHDLFDQLALVRHLHWLSTLDRGATRFSLICIGSYPGVADFTGLGPLSPAQLAALFPGREPVTEEQIALGAEVWTLFRGADPRPLADYVATADTRALPFLKGALRRFLEDFPWADDGLARSERQILRALADGNRTFSDVFVATHKMEERVFMGDTTFWSIVRRLAAPRRPLLTAGSDDVTMPEHDTPMALAEDGRAVLSGAADHVRLNGIDRWMGGAHLTTDRHWRWDGTSLIPQSDHRIDR